MAAAEESHWWYGATRALLRQMLAPYLESGRRVLDAGCGTGAAGGWLADEHRVVGVDAESLALELYRERRPRARLVRAGIERLPLRPASFDVALSVTVLYHEAVGDPAAAVRGLARAVRAGGIVCLLEPGLPRLRRAHDRVTRTARRFSRADLAGLLAGAGLEPVRATGAYFFLAAPAVVKAFLERGRTASDLASGGGGLGGVLPRLAALERRWLAHRDLPLGLSTIALGRRRD